MKYQYDIDMLEDEIKNTRNRREKVRRIHTRIMQNPEYPEPSLVESGLELLNQERDLEVRLQMLISAQLQLKNVQDILKEVGL